MINGVCKMMVQQFCNSGKLMAERVRVCSKTRDTGGNGYTAN